jgi:GH25 family lysozyme M1 (1,4-beta-N-acetylmuramidase)
VGILFGRRYRMKFGIDVSRWQGWPDDPENPTPAPDWDVLVSQGVLFAGVRASVGDYYIDPMFEYNYDNAKRVGIIPIPYWVLQTNLDSDAQAAKYLEALNGRDTWMDVADVEVLHSGSPSQRGRVLHYTMVEIGKETHAMQSIYTRQSFWDAHMPSGFLEDFSNRWLWVASYGANNGQVPPTPPYPRLPDIWEDKGWGGWQYTDKGSLDGVSSKQIDLDLMQDNLYAALRVRSGIPEPGIVVPPPIPPDPPAPGDLEQRVEDLELEVAKIKAWGENFPV